MKPGIYYHKKVDLIGLYYPNQRILRTAENKGHKRYGIHWHIKYLTEDWEYIGEI
jgi:hypothetical protein